MNIEFVFILNLLLMAKCQEDLEQCRASCYDRHHQATPMRGKQGPRGLPGPAGPPGNDFGDRFDGVEGRLVAMETRMRDQENEIQVLRMFKEESTRPENCNPIKQSDGSVSDGIFGVYPFPNKSKRVDVWCDMTSSQHGWTIIQRRVDGSVDFNRDWEEYAEGFGDKSGEYWLGLDAIHQITKNGDKSLRIEMTNSHGDKRFAQYESFYVGPAPHYRLEFDGFTGNAGDSMGHSSTNLDGMKFTTRDRDNDNYKKNCAKVHNGWWFNACFRAALNGPYRETDSFPAWQGIIWYTWLGENKSLRKVVMKIKPKY